MKDSLRAEIQEMIDRGIKYHGCDEPHIEREELSVGPKETPVSLSEAIRAILERFSLELVIEPRVPSIPSKVVVKKVIAK